MRLRSIALFYRERYIFVFNNIALAGIALAIYFIWRILTTSSDSLIPLHYNIFYGIDYLGWRGLLVLYLLAIGCMTVINFFVAYWLFTRDKYISYYLSAVSSFLSIFFLLYLLLLASY